VTGGPAALDSAGAEEADAGAEAGVDAAVDAGAEVAGAADEEPPGMVRVTPPEAQKETAYSRAAWTSAALQAPSMQVWVPVRKSGLVQMHAASVSWQPVAPIASMAHD